MASFSWHSEARTDEIAAAEKEEENVLTLDLLERLNKQRQGQYSKKQEVQRARTKFSELLQPPISGFIPKENPVIRITSQYNKIHRSQWFHHSKPLDLNYKKDSQGLIQRYKACYSQKGVIQIHSGRKRLVVRRYA